MIESDRADIEQALREETRTLETLNRVGQVVAAELNLERAVQVVTDAATEVTRAAFGAFFYNVRDEKGEAYTLYTLSGAPREVFAGFPMPRNTAVFGPTFRGDAIVRSDDITRDERYGKNAPHKGMPQGHLPVRSYLAVPVRSRSGEVLGGLFLGHSQPGVFSARDERLVAGIAAQAAIAIDNARLYQAAQWEIENRARAQAALRASETRFRLMADSAPVLIWMSDPTKAYTWFNRPWLEFTGRTMQQELRFGWTESVHIEDLDRCLQTYADNFEARQPFRMEYRLRRYDGDWRWMIDNGIPLFEGVDGAFSGFIGSCIDITDFKQAAIEREQLLQSERSARTEAERLGRLKDEFLATLSHELRTPLNAILGWATLLRRLPTGSPDHLKGVETIERNARVQAQIISDLLDMSRIISGKVQLDVQPVNLHDVITSSIDAIRPSAEAKGLRLRTTLDAKLGLIRGDPNRLQQILWNLLSNAVKFTPPGGRVDIVLERVNSHVEIAVEDSGVGIKPEFLAFVFDRFRQADASTTRRHGGLGLGLSIVKHLVELHGGTVRVKSPGEGKGATFIIALPVSVIRTDDSGRHERPALADVDLSSVELPNLSGITALVVDDEADARVLIGRLIEERGAQALLAAGAAEALHILASQPIDILVSDIGMPDLDGYELIQRVRTLEPARLRHLPAIALTAYARADDRQRALLTGYQMHLAKPIEPRELIAGIASLLNIRHRLRSSQ